MAAESGTVTVLEVRARTLVIAGLLIWRMVPMWWRWIDPGTHHSFYPVPAGANGRPTLLEREPIS